MNPTDQTVTPKAYDHIACKVRPSPKFHNGRECAQGSGGDAMR